MKSTQSETPQILVSGIVLAAAAVLAFGLTPGVAQQSGDADFVAPKTSINALMVALVDHAAHEIWEAASATTLTGRDWQTVEQHAIQLVASGTLVSLGGTGREDTNWAMNPAWQEWAQALSEGGLAALAASRNADQQALKAAGEHIIDACFGCHDMFKPDAPTEGLMHVPHYED
jgi:hypothetical protein